MPSLYKKILIGLSAFLAILLISYCYFYRHIFVETLPVKTLKPLVVSSTTQTTTTTKITAKNKKPLVVKTVTTNKVIIPPLKIVATTTQALTVPAALLGKWESQFGNGELAGMRNYVFNTDGTFTMSGYPAIDDKGTFTITKVNGNSYTLEFKTTTGYTPHTATVTVSGDSLSGIDNTGTYHRPL